MKPLVTSIDIAAPPEAVWEVLLDFARYPEWNPFVIEMTGPAEIGAQLKEVVRMPNGKQVTFKTTIIEMDAPKRLVWQGVYGVSFLVLGTHAIDLERLDNGHTRFTQHEVFTGLASPLLDVKESLRGYQLMNEAIKKRVEGA